MKLRRRSKDWHAQAFHLKSGDVFIPEQWDCVRLCKDLGLTDLEAASCKARLQKPNGDPKTAAIPLVA